MWTVIEQNNMNNSYGNKAFDLFMDLLSITIREKTYTNGLCNSFHQFWDLPSTNTYDQPRLVTQVWELRIR